MRLTTSFFLLLLLAPIAIFRMPQKTTHSDCPGDTVDRLGPETARLSRAFLSSLREAVKSNDQVKVASMIQYPLRVGTSKKEVQIRNNDEFIENYKNIVNEHVKSKILDEKSLRCLFANSEGFMVGDGELWFKEVSPKRFKIFTFYVDVDFEPQPVPKKADKAGSASYPKLGKLSRTVKNC